MIIFGSRAKLLEGGKMVGGACPSCHKSNSLVCSVISKYAHLFWIPLFPMGKKGVVECKHCKLVEEEKDLPDELKEQCKLAKSEFSTPLWQFTGLAILVVFFTIGGIGSSMDNKKDLEYVANPAVGDVYRYKDKDGTYSTWKVAGITQETVAVLDNIYGISTMSGISEIDIADNYVDLGVEIMRVNLPEMYESGMIYEIDREGV